MKRLSLRSAALWLLFVPHTDAIKSSRRHLGAHNASAGLVQPDQEEKGWHSPFPDNLVSNPKRCPTGYYHVACSGDSQEHKHWYHEVVPEHDRAPMSPKVCYDFCSKVTGAGFMGLTKGDRCYCSPFYVPDQSSGSCDVLCPGDKSISCGGQRMVDVYQLHDCNNLPPLNCKRPPNPIPNAKVFESNFYRKAGTPCSNTVQGSLTTVERSTCLVQCEEGYELEYNTLKCEEMGDRLVYPFAQVTGRARCNPVSCGFPPEMPFQTYPRAEIVFPEMAEYVCDVGYSIDADPNGPKSQSVTCKSNGKFQEVKECQRVYCGAKCPIGQGYEFATPKEKHAPRYGDACSYTCADGYSTDGRADGPTKFSISCLATGAFSQAATCKPVVHGPLPSTPNAGIVPKSTSLTVEDLTEDFQAVYPQTFTVQCDTGYSLNGLFGGETSFELKTTIRGVYEGLQTCKPVSCGEPPAVKNALYSDSPKVYLETVTYSCLEGYTTNGKASGQFSKTIACQANGEFPTAPKCKPIECGKRPDVELAETKKSIEETVTFENAPVQYVSKPGYSTAPEDNPWVRAAEKFSLSCTSVGRFSSIPEIHNINNCAWSNCGEFGVCEDLATPTGVALDDYTCNCISGYEITLKNSTVMPGELRKVCTNINDCPTPLQESCGSSNTQGIRRGACVDLINDYNCICSGGYTIGAVDNLPNNKTCIPVSCGTAPVIENSTCPLAGKEVNYDTPTWTYSCLAGYTLDGTAAGTKSFEVSCTSGATLNGVQACVPVSCGRPKVVANSDVTPKLDKVVFSQSLNYTCDIGYTTDGKADGPKTFGVDCNTGGELMYPDYAPPKPSLDTDPNGVPAPPTPPPVYCKPVECGPLATQANAEYDAAVSYVYPEVAEITCKEGYSIDASVKKNAKTYKMTCQADGLMPAPFTCTRVTCGVPPSYDHATRADAPLFYEDEITYTLEAGFEMKDVPPGGQFKCKCQANGKYDGPCEFDNLPIEPRDCGTPPAIAHSQTTGSTKYGGQLSVKADTGFTIDGSATGIATCTFRCQADGTFTEPCSFQAVKCGLCPVYDNTDSTRLEEGSARFLLQLGRGDWKGPGATKGKNALSLRSKRAVVARADLSLSTECAPVFQDRVSYSCAKGYYVSASTKNNALGIEVQQILPTLPVTFAIECLATGQLVEVDGAPPKAYCMPVTCDVTPVKPSVKEIPLLPKWSPDFLRLRYQETQDFICRDGYSVNGKPDGDVLFKETCESGGKLTTANECKDIDWCLINKCGVNGVCVDGLLTYTCTCNAGYTVAMVAGTFQTCVEIDECVTEGGNNACKPGGGTCKDKLLGYDCECADGYQHTTTAAGLDACTPKSCGLLPTKEFATSPRAGEKIVFPNTAGFSCGAGYTLDGVANTTANFELKCQATATFGGLENACKPVACGPLPGLERATLLGEKTELVYLESATYRCIEGHTTSGLAADTNEFSISCTTTGLYTKPGVCKPVICGEPPKAPNAVVGKGALREYSPDWFSKFRAPYVLVAKSASVQSSTIVDLPLAKVKEILGGELAGKRFFLQSTLVERDGDNLVPGSPFQDPPSTNNDFSQWAQVSCDSSCDCTISTKGRLGNHGDNSIINGGAGCQGSWRVTTGWATSGAYNMLFFASAEDTVACKITIDNELIKVTYDEQDITSTLLGGDLKNWGVTKRFSFVSVPGAQLVLYGKDYERGSCGTSGFAAVCRRGGHFGENIAGQNVWEATGSANAFPENDARLLGSGNGWNRPCRSTSGFNLPGEAAYTRIWTSSETVFAAFRWKVEPEKAVFGDTRTFTCKVGHTHDGTVAGTTIADVKCLANGTFSLPPLCVPVNCGYPAKKTNAQVPVREFRLTEEYRTTCDAGHTTSAEATGETSYLSVCSADGTYVPKTVPVETVKCRMSIDDVVKSVVYNNVDITSSVKGNLGTWNDVRTFEFNLVPGAYLAITGFDWQSGNSCNTGGFVIQCDKAIDTGSQWEAVGSPTEFTNGDVRLLGGGSGWAEPCWAPNHAFQIPHERIWAASNQQYATLRVKTEKDCEINPGEEKRTYSSIWGNNAVGTGHARSTINSAQGWSAARNEVGQWMQIDLGTPRVITGVVVQGRGDCCWKGQRVTKYTVKVSADGVAFMDIPGTFERNTRNPQTRVRGYFPEAVEARYVRFIVQAWEEHITMRAGVITCKKPLPPVPATPAAPGEIRPGMIVTLTGGRENKLCADEGHRIVCNRGAVGGWEKFEVLNAGEGKLALRGGNNRNICADESDTVRCNRGAVGPWEVFTVQKEEGKFALKGGKDGRWCADDGPGVRCNRGAIGQWERFEIKCIERCEVPPASVPEPEVSYECQPVMCGPPPAFKNSNSSDSPKVFGQVAEWQCKPGYSVDGLRTGSAAFVQQCMANGLYSRSTPTECVDIDFCFGAPCGAFGTCKDGGPGVLGDARYSCTCFEGYEPKKDNDGNLTCSADDCTGNECGVGGGCVDLSKSGGPDGEYTCECFDGYKLGKTESGKATCLRHSCGALPEVNNVQLRLDGSGMVAVTPFVETEQETDVFTNMPVLRSFDTALYTCAEGYSADGTTAPASKTFGVTCNGAGKFSRTLNKERECQPVRCPVSTLPTLPFASVQSPPASGNFLYTQKANFKCRSGYSLNGKAGGPDTIRLECQANGLFSSTTESCVPIECPVSTFGNATGSRPALYVFQNITYTCADGFLVKGKEADAGACDIFADSPVWESERKYSSVWANDGNHRRSWLDSPQAWSAATTRNGDWVELDLGTEKVLRGVVIQGRHDADQWVTKFSVKVSEDGNTWKEMGSFQGSKDRSTKVTALFTKPLESRFVRFTVEGYQNFPSMRAGVLVCSQASGKSTVVNVPESSRSYSTIWANDGNHRRSMLDSPQAWSAGSAVNGDWVQMDLGSKLPNVCGVVLQGRNDADQWVWRFTVHHSIDGTTWNSLPLDFAGSRDRSTKMPVFFADTIEARFIRIVVGGFWGFPSLRAAVITCQQDPALLEFAGTCKVDGSVGYDVAATECIPRRCSDPPAQMNATHGAIGTVVRYGDSFVVKCDTALTVGGVPGGATEYVMECQQNGKYKSSVTESCKEVRYTVSGTITDATDRNLKVQGALAVFTTQEGREVARATADAGGIYVVPLPSGNITVTVSHKNYIDFSRSIVITSNLAPGQGADFSLVKPLDEDSYRIVLTWDRYPSDLDSHTYFGCGGSNLVDRSRPKGSSDGAGGLEVALDRDAAEGFGAESTTITKAHRCVNMGCCLVHFKVEHVEPFGDGTLGASNAQVRVYRGSKEVAIAKVPTSVGSGKWWTALSIDISKVELELQAGMVVSLQGGRDGKFCADEVSQIICNRGAIGDWEKYEVFDAGSGKLALKGGNQKKFCADEGSTVKCDRGAIGGWEQFTITKDGDNWNLRGGRDGKLCSDDTSRMQCNRNAVGGWENFKIRCLSNCGGETTSGSWELEVDYPFNDLESMAGQTQKSCMEKCAARKDCNGLAFNPKDGYCWLKWALLGNPVKNVDRYTWRKGSKETVFSGEFQLPPFLVNAAAARGVESWSASFDSAGWSKVSSPPGTAPAVIYGLDLQHAEELNRLDAARFYITQNSPEADCVEVAMNPAWSEEKWAGCPVGYFLSGLYRTGSKTDNVMGYNQITQAYCCKGKDAPAQYGACENQEFASGKGWKQCSPIKGVASAITQFKALRVSVLPPPPAICLPENQPRRAVTGSGVFIGGNFIELGIRTNNQVGKMGTDDKPESFNGRFQKNGIGMTANAGGFVPKERAQIIQCRFAVDDDVRSVYYNGEDLTAGVGGGLNGWNVLRTISFRYVRGAYLVVTGFDGNAKGDNCRTGGFAMTCNKMIDSTSAWEAIGSDTPITSEEIKKGGGSGWGETCVLGSRWGMDPGWQLWTAKNTQYVALRVRTGGEGTCDVTEFNPPEVFRSYSSIWAKDGNHRRSMLDSPQAWSAQNNQVGEWMQIDLGEVREVAGVVVQGRADGYNQRVQRYKVQATADGNTWTEVLARAGEPQPDLYSVRVRSYFPTKIRARWVRFIVQEWVNHVSMRAGVLLCQAPPSPADAVTLTPGQFNFHQVSTMLDQDNGGSKVCSRPGQHVCNAQETTVYAIRYGVELPAKAWIVGGFSNWGPHRRSFWNGQDGGSVACQGDNAPVWWPRWGPYLGRIHCEAPGTMYQVACCDDLPPQEDPSVMRTSVWQGNYGDMNHILQNVDNNGGPICGADFHVCNYDEVTMYGATTGSSPSGWIVGGFPNLDFHRRSMWNGQDTVQCNGGRYPFLYPRWFNYYSRVHCDDWWNRRPATCCKTLAPTTNTKIVQLNGKAMNYGELNRLLDADFTGRSVCGSAGADWHVCNAQEATVLMSTTGIDHGRPEGAWIVGGFSNMELHRRSAWNGQDSVQCSPGKYPMIWVKFGAYYGRVHCDDGNTVKQVVCCRDNAHTQIPAPKKNPPKNDKLTIDYFLPGNQEESWWAGFFEGGVRQEIRNAASKVEDTTTDCSGLATARITGTLGSKLQIIQDLSIGQNDKYFTNVVTLKNTGPTTLQKVRFMRSFDPDNTVDQGGNFVTIQTLERTVPVDGFAVASAKSLVADPYYLTSGGQQATAVYLSSDPRAKASYGSSGLAPGGIYDPRVWDAPPNRLSSLTVDSWMSIAMEAPKLDPGESTQFTYFTSLDSSPVSEIVEVLKNADKKILQMLEAKCCTMQTNQLVEKK